MRGYSLLQKTNQIGLVRRIKTNLSNCCFTVIENSASMHIFGASHSQAERLTRQFLMQKHAGIPLHKAILYSLGKKSKIAYPLPKAWQEILTKQGLQIDNFRSTLAWIGLVTLYLGYGILFIARLTGIFLWATLKQRPIFKGRYAYFDGLTTGNLPQPNLDGRSHDICTWYTCWDDRVDDLDAICHSVQDGKLTTVDGLKVAYIGRPYHLLRNFTSVMHFLTWGVKSITISAIDALRGRWWHSLLLAEAAKAKAVQLCDPEFLAADYLFHYSGTIYRPMWTYEAEKKGARIICYFYSTSEQVKLPKGYESQRYEWGAASWPNYLVFDDYQANLIRRDIDQNATIKIVGPIWFSTSLVSLPEFPKKSIAVFDIQSHRRSAHFGFSTMAEYWMYNPGLNIQFLQDIQAVFSESGVTMVFKRKRDIPANKAIKKYMNLVQKLSQSKDVVLVNPNISAIRVIEGCKGIISMPFTSTALYMRDQGIPSAYYDPTGWIQKDDRGAHGIPILTGIEELRGWVESVFKDLPKGD